MSTYDPPRRLAAQGAEKQILIVGGSDMAVLHGVYDFFYHVLGMRWLEPGVTHTPQRDTFMQAVTASRRPQFQSREVGLLALWGEGQEEYRRAHWLSSEAAGSPGDLFYFENMAPEDASAANDGDPRRPIPYGSSEGAALALDELNRLIEAATDDAVAAARLKAVRHIEGEATLWRLAAMDWLRPVLSQEGRAINDAEESPNAAIIALANALAQGLAEAYPNETHWVQALLSPKMGKPPARLRPHPHVVVQLSTRDCNFAVPLSDKNCPLNRRFAEGLAGWRALGARIRIQDCLANAKNPGLPFPNLEVLQPNLLFYARHGVEGVHMAEVDATSPEAVDFAALRAYLASELLVDPDVVVTDLVQDFISRYYGANAASAISVFLDLRQRDLRVAGVALTADDDCAWLHDETLQEMRTLLQEALTASLPEASRGRVEKLLGDLEGLMEQRGLLSDGADSPEKDMHDAEPNTTDE